VTIATANTLNYRHLLKKLAKLGEGSWWCACWSWDGRAAGETRWKSSLGWISNIWPYPRKFRQQPMNHI